MTIIEKMKWVVLPSLLFIGIGVLETKYPHALDGIDFDAHYTRSGILLVLLLFLTLFLKLTWNVIGGILVIMFGILVIVSCFLPHKERAFKNSVLVRRLKIFG